MDKVQKLQLKQSELKVKLGELLDVPQEQRAESFADDMAKFSREVKAAEIELQAAILSQPDPDPAEVRAEDKPAETAEDKELLELRSSVHFGRYVGAAMAGGGIQSGAEHEYNQHLGLAPNQFPLDILAPSDVPKDLEKRAAIDGDAATRQSTWVDRLFSDTAAARLGVTFPSVGPGISAHPVITAGGTPAQRGRTQAAAASVYSFSVSELKPTRATVHGAYTLEDDTRLPGLSDAITRDMRAAMTEKIDRAIFVGDDGANENSADIVGFTTAAITELELSQTNKVKGLEWLKLFAALMDGKHAASEADLRIVLTIGANQLLLSTKEAAAVSNETIGRFLRDNGITWGVRGDIETATANGDFGAFIGLSRGIAGTAVAPVWLAGSLTVDRYTLAKSGEVQLTLSYLHAFGIPRPESYRRLKFVT